MIDGIPEPGARWDVQDAHMFPRIVVKSRASPLESYG